MIKLLKLQFQNIGRFTEKQVIDFSSKAKLIQLDGYNENTGGSSGAGKSTVFMSLDLLFGINDLPASSLQSRLTKDGFYVEGDFLFNDMLVNIVRSKKDGLKITVNGEVTEGSSKLCEEKLDELIKIPRKLFKKMIHKKQKEGGFFLELTAKESYQFFVDCLSLNEWEEKLAKTDIKIKELEDQAIKLDDKLEVNRFHIETLENTLKAIDIPVSIDITLFTAQKTELEKNIVSYTETIANFKKSCYDEINERYQLYRQAIPQKPVFDTQIEARKFEEELSLISKAKQDALALLFSQKQELINKTSKIRDVINQFTYEERQVSTLTAQNTKLQGELDHLLSNNCPTCRQKWLTSDKEIKISEINSNISLNLQKMAEIGKNIDGLPRLKNILITLNTDLDVKESEISTITVNFGAQEKEVQNKLMELNKIKFQAELEWGNKCKELELAHGAEKRDIEDKWLKQSENTRLLLEKAKEDVNSINNVVIAYEKHAQDYENLTKSTKNSIKTMTDEVKAYKKQQKVVEKQLKIANEAKRAIKTYTLQVFQDTLNFVGSYATKILNSVPAMANATLYFDNCKETKSGKIKDEINCIINIDGENDINIKTLSGGERTAVDLAVDLAVIEVLESQLGVGANWFVLDEPFNGMDTFGVEATLNIIKQIGLNKQIIIVDHHSETKELVEDTITIQRSGLYSSVLDGI